MPRLALVLWALLSVASVGRAEEFEAVSGRRSPDYLREKLADGSFKPETYAFGKGGFYGSPVSDFSLDQMDFMSIVHTIAGPLQEQKYLPASDPKATKLLIMVYGGTTQAVEHASDSAAYSREAQTASTLADVTEMLKHGGYDRRAQIAMKDAADADYSAATASAQAENQIRDQADHLTSMLLGYDSEWDGTFNARSGTAQARRRQDMMEELEHYRYFVVLMAYDFQLMAKHKKSKLLWEARFSIREQNHQFDQQLAAMVLQASRYFGKDSHGLTRNPLPEGKVEIGNLKSMGEVPAK